MTIIKLKDNVTECDEDLAVDGVANCEELAGSDECVTAKGITLENGELVVTID